MSASTKDRFRPFIENVDSILTAMKRKERIIEEQNTSDYSDASEDIKDNLKGFESQFNSVRNLSQNGVTLTDEQMKICEKVVQDANLSIESHSLKIVRDSIRELETFRKQISST